MVSVGRAAECDFVTALRGVSGRHLELWVVPAPAPPAAPAAAKGKAAANGAAVNGHAAAGGAAAAAAHGAAAEEPPLELRIRDVSTNGSGTSTALEQPWVPLRKGQTRLLGAVTYLVMPLNRSGKEHLVLTIRVIGDCLPDAFDSRLGKGRWMYHSKLGEGALGIVYRASDLSGRWPSDVAVKVSKMHRTGKPGARLRHAYILHREAQWSLQRLHNIQHPRHCADHASLFARYLEDFTGIWAPQLGFEEERTVFEASDFQWESFNKGKKVDQCPPHVVMELVSGRTLHHAMGWHGEPKIDPPLSEQDKVVMAKDMVKALSYFSKFGLIHRDFRTTNIMLTGRGPGGIRVIDLGHTIAGDPEQVSNRSAVVRCSWKETNVKHFDWAPAEVKGTSPVNFSFPIHAFDAFSLAVLLLQLELGNMNQARSKSTELAAGGSTAGRVVAVGLGEGFLGRMLGPAQHRPAPAEVLQALEPPPKPPPKPAKPKGGGADALRAMLQLALRRRGGGSRSRSRDRRRGRRRRSGGSVGSSSSSSSGSERSSGSGTASSVSSVLRIGAAVAAAAAAAKAAKAVGLPPVAALLGAQASSMEATDSDVEPAQLPRAAPAAAPAPAATAGARAAPKGAPAAAGMMLANSSAFSDWSPILEQNANEDGYAQWSPGVVSSFHSEFPSSAASE